MYNVIFDTAPYSVPYSYKKLSDALGVTVSYLTGESAQKTIKDELNPKVRRHLEKLQNLPPKDQNTVMRMVDGLAAENGIKNEAKDAEE